MLFLLIYAALFGLYYLIAGGIKSEEKTGDELAPEGKIARNRAGSSIPILYGRSFVAGVYIDASKESWTEIEHEEDVGGGGC